MKITKTQLKQIIKEELSKVLSENPEVSLENFYDDAHLMKDDVERLYPDVEVTIVGDEVTANEAPRIHVKLKDTQESETFGTGEINWKAHEQMLNALGAWLQKRWPVDVDMEKFTV